MLLHATTSSSWEAQFHRHIAGRDDCINCRLPAELPAFSCATAPVTNDGGASVDAAVPALSATAGLMLNAALVRLSHGELADGRQNYTSIDLGGPVPVGPQRRIWDCTDGCSSRQPPSTRALLEAGSRYLDLDPVSRLT
ncbi:MAG TPA: hypothetical protein VKR30_10465 [Candidatus Limnocylindrales bacterium]|nr:hypothetical protein [Candidatus Limnocylindrales bacterium]